MRSPKPADPTFSVAILQTGGRSKTVARRVGVAPTQLDVVGPGAAADVEQGGGSRQVDVVAEFAGGNCRQRMHRLPEQGQHQRVLAVEQVGLLVGIPARRPVGAHGLDQPAPGRVQPAVEHLHPAAEMVGLAAYEELVGERTVDIAPVPPLEQPDRRARGDQQLSGALLNAQRFGEFLDGAAAGAGQMGEQVQLIRGRERLERPEADGELHQWQG